MSTEYLHINILHYQTKYLPFNSICQFLHENIQYLGHIYINTLITGIHQIFTRKLHGCIRILPSTENL